MEKISIVRRRLEVTPTQAELRARQRAEMRPLSSAEGSTALALLPEPGFGMPPAAMPAGEMGTAATAPELSRHTVTSEPLTVDLTPEARNELWSSGHLDETPSGTRHFIVEAARDREDDKVVLKLEFMKPEYYLRLLTTEEVCEMLHLSKSCLYHYARRGHLRTYRMGRTLRFRFQDVLDFITACQVGKA